MDNVVSLGLMSGTSMDGIDAALIETDGTPRCLRELASASFRYDLHFSLLLKGTEYAVRQCAGDLEKAKLLFPDLLRAFCDHQGLDPSEFASYRYEEIERQSTKYHIELVQQLLAQSGYDADRIAVIGYHGQTLYHQPESRTLVMLGDPQYLADALKIKVVYDFRRQDIQAGGQGAPLAPLYHYALGVRDHLLPLAVVNCGGIANLTAILADAEEAIVGFDTGPGNALLDSCVRQRTQGREVMDRDGQYGRRGRVHTRVLEQLYQQAIVKNGKNYFTQPPPKSLDYGDIALLPALERLSLEDACATLAAFTADTVVQSVQWLTAVPQCWVLAGGGWKNPNIREQLIERLQQRYGRELRVYMAEDIGWNNDALEAQIFAYLAVRSLYHQPLSFPNTTNVPYPVTGGMAYMPTL